MMILCKSFFSLLGFPEDRRRRPPHRCRETEFGGGGLRLLSEEPRPPPPNVLESSAIRHGLMAGKPDPGSWGLHEAEGGGCTESLGSESCDVSMGVDVAATPEKPMVSGMTREKGRGRRQERTFPPPLAWLAGRNGRRSRFMKAVRGGNRIVLTEVVIERPEILRASRHDGRLKLELVRSYSKEEEEIDLEEEEGTAAAAEEEEAAVERWAAAATEEEEKAAVERWAPPPLRCQDQVSGGGAEVMWWSQRFVTTA